MHFTTEKCAFLQNNAFSCRKMHCPAENCCFQGGHVLIAGLQGSRIKNAGQLSQDESLRFQLWLFLPRFRWRSAISNRYNLKSLRFRFPVWASKCPTHRLAWLHDLSAFLLNYWGPRSEIIWMRALLPVGVGKRDLRAEEFLAVSSVFLFLGCWIPWPLSSQKLCQNSLDVGVSLEKGGSEELLGTGGKIPENRMLIDVDAC